MCGPRLTRWFGAQSDPGPLARPAVLPQRRPTKMTAFVHDKERAPAVVFPTELSGAMGRTLGSPVRSTGRRSSQLFPAFVWGTLAHKVARKRRSIDKLHAEDACIA
jgi:hypothetical protein